VEGLVVCLPVEDDPGTDEAVEVDWLRRTASSVLIVAKSLELF
jgi:hypothetical protein